jgi:two-component system, OmpR family, sensor histidine kinase KdpD
VMAAADVRAVVLLPNQKRQLAPSATDSTGGEKGDRSNLCEAPGAPFRQIGPVPFFSLSVHDEAVARWVLENGRIAGRGTATLPGSQGVYLPLPSAHGTVGVLGVVPSGSTQTIDIEQLHLLEAFAGLIALALERADLELEADQIRLDIETERLRNSLLSAVSHDLRTPLSVVTGASSALLENESLDPAVRRELAASILDESERLNRLVANLLDMTRLQAGALELKKQWQPVEEVIGASLARLSRQLQGHPVATHVAADLPFAPFDDLLVQQVLVNLLENAARHTPAGTPIEVSARHDGDSIVIEVADCGPGLPPGDPNRLFEKFYRAGSAKTHTGAGLGLAICRGIVQLHGGKIQAENRTGGGAVFRFSLPLEGEAPTLAVEDAIPTTPDSQGKKAEP